MALVVCALPLSLPLALAACDKAAPAATSTLGVDEIPLRVDLTCPGDPACKDDGDGQLQVGTARREITPLVEPFVDKNGNGVYDAGEPFTDLDGDGRFNPVWLAGRDSGTLAFGVHDPIWARCYALRQNQTTLVHCVIDALGIFQDEERQVRADLDPALGVDLFMLGATHNHQAFDTVGTWGPNDTTTGYDPALLRRTRLLTVEAATEAVRRLRPAKMSIASIAAADDDGDMVHYVSDTRDPVVIDNRMHVLQFDGQSDGKPIVTLVNWSSHPDSLGVRRHYISSDFVHYLRETVESAVGDDVVYITGSVGGQIGPGRVEPRMEDGSVYPHEQSYRFIDVWGRALGRLALKAFAARKDVAAPKLAFRHTTFAAHIENIAFHTAFVLGLYHRDLFGFDRNAPLLRTPERDNTPLVETEVGYITLGPAAMITAPGELLPESFLGGYDGSYAGKYRFSDATQPNSPDYGKAPKPPYLIDLMDGEREHRMVFGLTLDFLGYIVPRYNFVLDPDAPYLQDAPGDHYEETNSVGSRAEPEFVGTMRQIITVGRSTK